VTGSAERKALCGDSANLRFGLLDLAGNFSGYGPTTRFNKPILGSGEGPAGGCAVASDARDGWLLAPLLALIASQRRARHPPFRDSSSARGRIRRRLST
jgi:hypothetical protein